jgi:hypothetical protein
MPPDRFTFTENQQVGFVMQDVPNGNLWLMSLLVQMNRLANSFRLPFVILFVCVILAWPTSVRADVIALPTSTDMFSVGTVYRAKSENVPSADSLADFRKSILRVPSVDLRGGRYWLNVKVRVENGETSWALGRLGSYIENVELWAFDGESTQYGKSGQFYQNDYPLHYGVRVNFEPGKTYDVWILFESRYFTGMPTAHLLPEEDYSYEVLIDNLLIIGCLGSIMILALYNLLLWCLRLGSF